jgi:hypothetical protein
LILRKCSGTEVKLDGEEHRIVDTEDILGVVEGQHPTTVGNNHWLRPLLGPLFRAKSRRLTPTRKLMGAHEV